jgi:acyl-CoA reductase-like NAD-dependent aldehyde dehydrogenase
MGTMIEPTLDEMLEIAAKRESANETIIDKVSDEDFEKVMDAVERQELAKKSFEELTRDERIKLALEEVDWIVIGGQDGQEFYGSIQFIRKVLRSLR